MQLRNVPLTWSHLPTVCASFYIRTGTTCSASYLLSLCHVYRGFDERLAQLATMFLSDATKDPHDLKHLLRRGERGRAAALINLEIWLTKCVVHAGGADSQFVNLIDESWFEHMQQRAPDVYRVLGKSTHDMPLDNNIFSTRDNLNGAEISVGKCQQSLTSKHESYSISWTDSAGEMITMDNLPLPKSLIMMRRNSSTLYPKVFLCLTKRDMPSTPRSPTDLLDKWA